MINKLKKLFEIITLKTNGQIKDKEHLDHFIHNLKMRKILIDHDVPLLHKYILDFPLNFSEFSSYIRQIFMLDIEKQIEAKLNSIEDTYQKIMRFLHFYSLDDLNSEDVKIILNNLNINLEIFKATLKNFRHNEFLLKSIRYDTKHFLWEKIIDNIRFQNGFENPDFFISDSNEYQLKMNHKIEYELEIIKTRRILTNPDKSKLIKKIKKIKIEKVYCANRDIPIQSWKVPTNFYDREILNKIFFQCEALKELLLSKYFQKFTGFDDLSSDEYFYYFFENLEGLQLISLIKQLDLDISENSLLFKYLANEILKGLQDLLYKSTYSFEFPVNLYNIFYEASQLRLYFTNINFGPKRKTILESHQIIEAKLLFFYGMILINLLAISKPELNELSEKITNVCDNLNEIDKMRKIFDIIPSIEEKLTYYLESDVIIAIIVECLVSPYKAKILFDEFYEKKNFLKDAIERKNQIVQESTSEEISGNVENLIKCNIKNCDKKVDKDDDQLIAYENYYDKEEDANDDLMKKMMTINYLLIHPFYRDFKIEDSLLSILFHK